MSSPHECFAPTLPDQSLKRVLGIGAQKPCDGKENVGQQGSRDEPAKQREQRRTEQPGTRRQASEQDHQQSAPCSAGH